MALAAIGVAAGSPPGSAAERAYELVSPSGVDADVRFGSGVSTPDGDFVCWHSERAYLGAFVTGLVTSDTGYCASRTFDGWRGEWATGPGPEAEFQGTMGAQVYFVSPDARRVVFASDTGIFRDYADEMGGAAKGTLSSYVRESGTTRWVAPAPTPPVDENILAGGYGSREPLGVSDDRRYGVFASRGRLLAQDGNTLIDVYKWTPAGIELVSADASGNAVGGAPPTLQPPFLIPRAVVPGGISADGGSVFFHHRGRLAGDAPDDAVSVYVRGDDGLRLVSPRRGPAGSAADVRFAGASADASVVYLVTTQQLTDEVKQANDALYRYDVIDDTLSLVATHPDGILPLDLSRDGETFVYTTKGPMPPLVVWRNGAATTIGTAVRAMDGDDIINSFFPGGVVSPRPDRRALRISADGRVIVFASAGEFAGATMGTMRVYRWEAGVGVRPVSVSSDGEVSTRQAMIGNYSTINLVNTLRLSATLATMRGNVNVGRGMSDDGRRIFFETDQRLVDQDVNDVVDVYEWEDDVVRLVSPGTQTQSALYHDSSADGSTVFFTTAARLIPELDRNSSRDLYAARIGGGFRPTTSPPECQGASCQGDPTPQPPSSPAGTSVFEGPGDQDAEAPVAARFSVRKLTARQRRALVRRGRVVLRVRGNVRGLVTVRAVARVKRRALRVGRTTRVVRPGATVRVPLVLTRRARAALRQVERLRVVITVTHSEVDRTVRQVVMLRAA